MHNSFRPHNIFALSISILCLSSPAVLAEPALPVAPPQGDRGPAILVPTDVTGGHGFDGNVLEAFPVVKTTKFHARPDAKSYLLETTSDTTCKSDNGDVKLEKGAIIVCPQGGHVIVHTKTADVAVPHDTVALVECVDDSSRIFNLAGHDLVVHCLKSSDPDQNDSKNRDSITIQEGLGYIDNAGELAKLPKGCTLLDHSMITNSAIKMEDRKHFKLAILDPMTVLQYHAIAKQLKTDWVPAMKKIEQAAQQMLSKREKLQNLPKDDKKSSSSEDGSQKQ